MRRMNYNNEQHKYSRLYAINKQLTVVGSQNYKCRLIFAGFTLGYRENIDPIEIVDTAINSVYPRQPHFSKARNVWLNQGTPTLRATAQGTQR
mgnify:CR=1 FL=1